MDTPALAVLPGGHRWQPVTADDLAELVELLAVIETADCPRERHSLTALTEDLTAGGADPVRDTRLVRDGHGAVVGYGWNHPQHSDTTLRRVLLTGGVHPDRRRTGLGHALFSWQLAAARAWDVQTRRPGHGPLRYLTRADNHLLDRQRLAEDHGLQATRWFAHMSLRFSTAPPAPRPVTGVELVLLDPEHYEAARLTNNAAFDDHWGSQPIGVEQWREQLTSAICRPEWSLVAVEVGTGAVVGYAINMAYEAEWGPQGFTEGQTERLGVLRDWRHRGVASALLGRSMQLFHAAGLQAAGLGVDSDNPTGAYPLYQHLGYRVIGGFVVHTRTEPGDEG